MHHLFIISGPSGVGKTTVVKELLKRFPELRTSVTYTTRERRPSAEEDKTMHYITKEAFLKKQQAGDFLEWAEYNNNYYGTARSETESTLRTNPILMNIDVQGARQIADHFPENSTTIFLVPESSGQMAERIKRRATVTEEELAARLATAEMELRKKDTFDYQIINKEARLKETVESVAQIIQTVLRST